MARTPFDSTPRAAPPELDTSTTHVVLSDARRRHVLDTLDDLHRSVSLDELATAIAEREDGLDPENPTQHERVAVTLHHVHLPLLADAGVVDYAPETKTIEPNHDTIAHLVD